MIKPVPVASRAAAVACLATALSAAGHVGGGGRPPTVASLTLIGALAWLCALAGSRRRWTTGGLLIVIGSTQLLAHVVFSMGAPAAHAPFSAPAMSLSHLAAAAVTAMLLANADELLRRLRTILATVIETFRPDPAGSPSEPFAPALTTAASEPFALRASARLVRTAPRRGPPTA